MRESYVRTNDRKLFGWTKSLFDIWKNSETPGWKSYCVLTGLSSCWKTHFVGVIHHGLIFNAINENIPKIVASFGLDTKKYLRTSILMTKCVSGFIFCARKEILYVTARIVEKQTVFCCVCRTWDFDGSAWRRRDFFGIYLNGGNFVVPFQKSWWIRIQYNELHMCKEKKIIWKSRILYLNY